ncbi:ubinuclein-2-like isoform X2 [Microplitis mediator]|uniref:ubinuclein-2-like isoform X2 n=1 Tax=Microplitis mediator TaxID=375433 RepID=UPI00255373A7|nr:ubinuclein-2-like isoform X2 [Microplitis mediator]
MSESVKRVPTQSLELPGSLGNANKKEKKREKGKQLAPSFRLELSLDDKNETAYAEFNYTHLLKTAEKKRSKENKNTNGQDPFDDDDDDDETREIAKRFEAKYGTTNSLKNKKKKYYDDVDLGAGYDENDSFIDNTDAYDEVVPLGVTTAHGGFYINSGPLEFDVKEGEISLSRTLNNLNNDDSSSSESSDDDEDSNSPVPKRRDSRLISSSDEDDEEIVEPAPKKSKLDENGEKKVNYDNMIKKKKKLLTEQQQQPQQPQQQQQQQSVDSSNKQKNVDDKRDHMEVDIASDNNQDQRKKLSCDVIKPKDTAKKFVKKPMANGLDDSKKLDNGKKLSVKDSNIDDAIDSVVNDRKVDDDDSRDTEDSSKSRCVAGTSSECEDGDKIDNRVPDNLPEEIKDIINKLKKHVESNKDGKMKFFDSYANAAILSLDTKLRQLDSPAVKNQVYAHLAPFMSCSKITLTNRIKKLSLAEAENKVREPTERLKGIIEQMMPSAVQKYEEECRRVAEDKSLEASLSDEDSSDGNEKPPKKPNFPRKRFPWTTEAKKAVCDIATAWQQYYKVRRPRKENMESFVSAFMESKILPLWPKGWITLETLLKYSNPDTTGKRKPKKSKDNVQANNIQLTTNNCSPRLENPSNTSSLIQQERSKTPTNLKSSSLENINYTSPSQSVKSSEVTTATAAAAGSTERKQSNNSSKHKDKIRESSTSSSQHDISGAAPIAKISVVPTSQLMAQKPAKAHSDKFNPLNLTSSTVSITPVNDYQKANKLDDNKKDVVSITPFSDVPAHPPDLSLGRLSIAGSFGVSNNPGSKSLTLKHRILHDNVDKRIDDRDVIDAVGGDTKDKKRDRWVEERYKSGDIKKRRKDIKAIELNQQSCSITKHEVSSILQPKSGLSQEEIDRQIEETEAATNYLSQIINDESRRSANDSKRKESSLIDDSMEFASTFPPSEQDKDVQMVMRSLKELQELQENKYSPSNSPLQKSKSSHQYVGFSDDYHRHYHNKKDDKLNKIPKDEPPSFFLSRD